MARKTRDKKTSVGEAKTNSKMAGVLQSGPSPPAPAVQRVAHRWTFLTNHAHVLILLNRNPSMVLREVAALVGITERAVQRIIAEMEEEGFLEREKVGRQNHYRVLANKPLRHPIESHRKVADLLQAIDGDN